MANVQVFLAVPFEVGLPDVQIQELQDLINKLTSGQLGAGPANPPIQPAPAPTPSPAPSTGATDEASFLAAIGAAQDATRLAMVDAWQRCEGGSNHNNPLNVTAPLNGSWSWPGQTGFWNNLGNGYGVVNFDTVQHGWSACSQNLVNGTQFGGIRQALINGDSAAFKQAIASEPWGTDPVCIGTILGV